MNLVKKQTNMKLADILIFKSFFKDPQKGGNILISDMSDGTTFLQVIIFVNKSNINIFSQTKQISLPVF